MKALVKPLALIILLGLGMLPVFGSAKGNQAGENARLKRTGTYPCCGPLSTPKLLWETALPASVISTCLLIKGQLILEVSGGGGRYWVNLDESTGKIKWSAKRKRSVGGGLAECGGFLYSGDQEGDLLKISIQTGEVLQRFPVSKQWVSALFGKTGKVYYFSEKMVGCFSTATDQRLWKTSLPGKPILWSPPVVTGDIFVFTLVRKLYEPMDLAAVSVETGRLLWVKKNAVPFFQRGAIRAYGGSVILNLKDTGLARVEASTGKIIQVIRKSERPSIFVLRGDVLFYAPDATGRALLARNLKSGRIIWKAEVPVYGDILSDMELAISGDALYCQSPSLYYYAFNTQSGELLWKFSKGTGRGTKLLPARKRLFVIGGGQVRCLGSGKKVEPVSTR